MGNFANGPHSRQSCWISSCHQGNFDYFSDFVMVEELKQKDLEVGLSCSSKFHG